MVFITLPWKREEEKNMQNSGQPKLLRWHTHFAQTNSRFGLPSWDERPFLGWETLPWISALTLPILFLPLLMWWTNWTFWQRWTWWTQWSLRPPNHGRCGHLGHCGHVRHGGHCGHLGYLGKGWHGGHGGNGLKGLHDGHGRQSLHGVHERVFQNPLIWKTNLFVTFSYSEKNLY